MADYARQNFAINATNGEVIEAVLWSEPDHLVPFPESDLVKYESAGSYGVEPNLTSEKRLLRTQTLDLLKFQNRISVAKFDIQGSELEAWRGARSFIESHQPTLIFEFEELLAIQFGHVFHDYVDFLISIQYRVVEFIGSNDFLAVPEAYLAKVANWNLHRRRKDEQLFMKMISV